MNQHVEKLANIWSGLDIPARERIALCWKGRRARSWALSVYEQAGPEWAAGLPDERHDRRQLLEYLSIEADQRRRIAAVLAWGGMFTKNGRLFRAHFDACAEAAANLNGTRAECYRTLNERNDPGLGPAYFTKLIRYLRPNATDTGYIMDQWLARSINLIFEAEPESIRMNGQGRKYVDRANTAETYEWFCASIEGVAAELSATAEQAEILMFASREWRQYLTGKPWHRYEC